MGWDIWCVHANCVFCLRGFAVCILLQVHALVSEIAQTLPRLPTKYPHHVPSHLEDECLPYMPKLSNPTTILNASSTATACVSKLWQNLGCRTAPPNMDAWVGRAYLTVLVDMANTALSSDSAKQAICLGPDQAPSAIGGL